MYRTTKSVIVKKRCVNSILIAARLSCHDLLSILKRNSASVTQDSFIASQNLVILIHFHCCFLENTSSCMHCMHVWMLNITFLAIKPKNFGFNLMQIASFDTLRHAQYLISFYSFTYKRQNFGRQSMSLSQSQSAPTILIYQVDLIFF